MTQSRRQLTPRDQGVSPFSVGLMGLCDAVSASAAALVDAEGETVDYAGTSDPFEIRVAAAEWRLTLNAIQSSSVLGWAESHEVTFRGSARSYAVIPLEEGYAIVLELPTHSFRLSRRAAISAVRQLSTEAGLPLPPAYARTREKWLRVDVRTDSATRRPLALWHEGRWREIMVLGRLAETELEPRERGYRVRVDSGREATIIREPFDRWYIDDPMGNE